MQHNLEPITEFIQYKNDKPVLDSAGLPVLAPVRVLRTIEDVKLLIEQNAPQNVIELFAKDASEAEQWQFAREYIEYLAQLVKTEAHNTDLPVIGEDDNGDDVLAEPIALPDAPAKPSVKTVEEILAPFKPKLTKMAAFEFKGVQCSICEQDQNGIEVLYSRYKELKAAGVAFYAFPFFMENKRYVVLDNENEWLEFREAFWNAREAYMMAKVEPSNEA